MLLPLRDVAPDYVHPGSKIHIDELISRLPPDQMIRPLGSMVRHGGRLRFDLHIGRICVTSTARFETTT